MGRKKHEEHENHERWLVSYADFITLLFAFFTVLYATAQTDQQKLEAVIDGLNAAFEGGMPMAVLSSLAMGTTDSPLLGSHLSMEADASPEMTNLKQNLSGSFSDHTVQIGLIDQTLTLVLPEKLLFAAGSADLHPTAFSTLTRVAEAVSPTTARIDVYGHADGVPVAPNSPHKDNWGLASARSVAVVRYLERRGVKAEQLTATATITSGASPEARAVTLKVYLDTPRVAAEVADRLTRSGLMGP